MKQVRAAMFVAGLFCAFLAACAAEAEILLGCCNTNRIMNLLTAAVIFVCPALIHFRNTGRF